ncbi:MAG: hypothetical protein J7502_12315, partial [Flavisolibacter sp.]|nr:hypothetical protein [Flavisolibacter sp.]
MSRTVLPFLVLAFFFSSCRSISFFETPNALRNIPAILHLVNGRSYQGNLIVHTSKHSNSAVKLYTEDDKKPMRFGIHHIKGYELRNQHYELKEIKGGIRLGKEYSFMKRLTKENSRIHLYENTRKVSHPGGKHTSSYRTYETDFFLALSGDESGAVWNLNSSRFVPDFNGKMSELLKRSFGGLEK